MIPSELYDLFRQEVDDTEAPYFWSNTEVESFSDRAEEMFCRLTGGIQDASSALATLAIVASNPWVTYSPLILRIVTASLTSTNAPLTILNPPDLQDDCKAWGPKSINLPGRVIALVAGLDDTKLKVVQVPQATDSISLVLERLPLVAASAAGAFEIPAQHHYYLLHWMKRLAYLKQDSQTFDKVKAEEEGAQFIAYCKQALEEKERRKNKPRLMQYGGIGGENVAWYNGRLQQW